MIIAGLIASVAAMLVAIGMLTTLVPLHAALAGFDAATIGRIAGGYYLGFLAGPWLGPPLVARIGRRGTFALAAALAAGGVAMLPVLPDPLAWGVLRFAAGIGFALLYILVEAGLNMQSADANRGRVLSAYLIVSQSALVAGEAMVGALGVRGALPFLVAAALVALAAAMHHGLPTGDDALETTARLRPMPLLRAAPLAAIGTILFGMSEAIFLALGPLFARGIGLGVAQIAAFMAAHMIGGAVSQWPLGVLSDRFDRRAAILSAAVGSAAFALALAVPPAPGFWLATAGSFLLGAFLLPIYGLLVALANDDTDPGERIALSSGLVLAYAVGACVGPPVAAMLMAGDIRFLPLSAAVIQAALAAAVAAAMMRRRAAAAAAHAKPLSPPDLAPSPRPEA